MTKDEVKQIVDGALVEVDKIEKLTVDMISELYKDGNIKNEDLYFLTELCKLTRTYGDLIYQLPDVIPDTN